MANYDTELNIYGSEVIANQKKITTSDVIYNKIYAGQILEIFKLSIAFLFSQLILRLLDNTILKFFINNTLLYAILIISMSIAMLLLAGSIFTYIKITNEKDSFFDTLIK